MLKEKIYPNYINRYYYTEGDSVILLKRYRGGKIIYSLPISFDTPDEAKKYFEENCGE